MTPPAARRRSQFIDAVIDDYAAAHSAPPDAHQLGLQRITQEKTGRAAGMQIGDDQAVLMEMLVRAMGGTRAVEIGTFTGYSALAVARGLGPAGARCAVTSARSGRQSPGRRGRKPGSPAGSSSGSARAWRPCGHCRPASSSTSRSSMPTRRAIPGTTKRCYVTVIRSVNDVIAADPRVKVVLIPIGDGVSVVQKLGEQL
jgi:caffeoyl-CoA O-methyltransferase